MAAPATPKRRYGDNVEIERGLAALIIHGGNAEAASEASGIPGRTLRSWKDRHAARYQDLQNELAPRIAERIASEAEEMAVKLARLENKVIDRLENQINTLDADKAASALRNISTSKSLQVDRISSPLRGRPSVITEHRAGDDLLRGLANRVGITIDHIEDAEIVEDEKPLLPEGANANARTPDSAE